MHALLRSLPLPLGAALALAPLAAGQVRITTLVEEGDAVPGLGLVTSIRDVATNDAGDWLVEVDTDYPVTSRDGVLIHNGSVIMAEGVPNSGFDAPAGATMYDLREIALNDAGQVMVALSATRADGFTRVDLVAVDGATIVETGTTPAPPELPASASTWSYIDTAWFNAGGDLVVAGSVLDGADHLRVLARFALDGQGGFTSQTAVAYEGELLPGHDALVRIPANSRSRAALNDAGQLLWMVSEEDTTLGGAPNGCCDAYYYLDAAQVLREGSPTGFGQDAWASLYSSSVDLGRNGDWAGRFRTSEPSPAHWSLVKNGALLARSGDVVPDVDGAPTITTLSGPVSVTALGGVVWQCSWPGPGSGLFLDDRLLVQQGVTTQGGDLITQIPSNDWERDVSADGNSIVQVMRVARPGGDRKGAHLISLSPVVETFCFGDGVTGACPCGNFSAAGSGEGCAHSAGYGARLSATGSPFVADDDVVFTVSQARPGQPSVLVQGAAQRTPTPFKDGAFCLGNPTVRVEAVALDADGAGMTSGSIVTRGEVVPGDTRYYQQWFLDPGGSPCGSGSNFTNAVRIDWR